MGKRGLQPGLQPGLGSSKAWLKDLVQVQVLSLF
jgi:hypothetical protein